MGLEETREVGQEEQQEEEDPLLVLEAPPVEADRAESMCHPAGEKGQPCSDWERACRGEVSSTIFNA